VKRILIFGDPADMGTDAEVNQELCDMDAAEAAAEAEEKELAECEKLQEEMHKRGRTGLQKIA
jgi:hypothetical protein